MAQFGTKEGWTPYIALIVLAKAANDRRFCLGEASTIPGAMNWALQDAHLAPTGPIAKPAGVRADSLVALHTRGGRDSANRSTNIIVGLVFVVFYVFHLLGHLMQAQLLIEILVMCVATIVVPALIVWYAWRWPIQEAKVTDPLE